MFMLTSKSKAMQKRIILNTAIFLVVGVITLLLFSKEDSTQPDLKTTISEIKQIARLNTVQAEEDHVFIDTIENIGVVYITTVNIDITFDVDNLNFKESNDTLFVEMPSPSVSIHQIKEEFVTAFYTGSQVQLRTPDITPELSMEIHKNMEDKLYKNIWQGDLVRRASENAKVNMKNLFSAFSKKIVIVESL